MKTLFIQLINIYQISLSPYLRSLLGHACRFNPTCSEYAKLALEEFGVQKGGSLALKRILRCHPFNKGGYDPIPNTP